MLVFMVILPFAVVFFYNIAKKLKYCNYFTHIADQSTNLALFRRLTTDCLATKYNFGVFDVLGDALSPNFKIFKKIIFKP